VWVGAQEKQDLVKTYQLDGIGETAPAKLGQDLLRTKAVAGLEAAL
jgi:hypothetical protein